MLRHLCVAAAAAILAVLAFGSAGASPASDGFFYETKPVTDHVTLIYRPDPVRVPAEGNVTVIEQTDGLVVVDAGGSPVGGTRIVAKIRVLSKKPVRYLVYTHYHDLVSGAGAAGIGCCRVVRRSLATMCEWQ